MSLSNSSSLVTTIPPASPMEAAEHYTRKLSLETDCADVHAAIVAGNVDFTLLDVRGSKSFEKAHLPSATNLTRDLMTKETLSCFEHTGCFVVYCAGPHCNGADKAAAIIASMGFPVKIMIGGMTGWADEGFRFEGTKI